MHHITEGLLIQQHSVTHINPGENEGEFEGEFISPAEEGDQEAFIYVEFLHVVDEDVETFVGDGTEFLRGELLEGLHVFAEGLEGDALGGVVVGEELAQGGPEDFEEGVLLLGEDGVDFEVGVGGEGEEMLDDGGFAAAALAIEDEGGVGVDEVGEEFLVGEDPLGGQEGLLGGGLHGKDGVVNNIGGKIGNEYKALVNNSLILTNNN